MDGGGPDTGRMARFRFGVFCATALERMQTVVIAKKIFFIRWFSFLYFVKHLNFLQISSLISVGF
jgi:hypothetical protein